MGTDKMKIKKKDSQIFKYIVINSATRKDTENFLIKLQQLSIERIIYSSNIRIDILEYTLNYDNKKKITKIGD